MRSRYCGKLSDLRDFYATKKKAVTQGSDLAEKPLYYSTLLARPRRFERLTAWFVARDTKCKAI